MTNVEEQIKATDYALNLISYRKRSETEILNALNKKGFDNEYIIHTINYLKENKYILEYKRNKIEHTTPP